MFVWWKHRQFYLLTVPLGFNWAHGSQTHHCKLFCVRPLKHLPCAMTIYNYQPGRGGEEAFFFFQQHNSQTLPQWRHPFFKTSAHLIAISLVSADLPPVPPLAVQLLQLLHSPRLQSPSLSTHLNVISLIKWAYVSLERCWLKSAACFPTLLLFKSVPTLTLIEVFNKLRLTPQFPCIHQWRGITLRKTNKQKNIYFLKHSNILFSIYWRNPLFAVKLLS